MLATAVRLWRHDIHEGGTDERGLWTFELGWEARRPIVDEHIDLFTAMRLAA